MPDDTISPDLAASFEGFASQAEPSHTTTETDILEQLLAGEADDPEAIEPSQGELAVLEDEFSVLAALTRRKEELEGQLSHVNAHLEAQKARMLAAMDAQGTAQFKSAGGPGACSPRTDYRTKVTDPVAFLGWVQERHPELLTVNSQTRTSFVRKEYRDRGVDPDSPDFPPGIEVAEHRSLMVRGVKKGAAKK